MRKILAVIGIISAIALGSIGFLAANRQSKAASSFQGGGYILGGSSEEESSVPYGTQFYFNDGAAYSQNRSSDTISFKTISGDKATVKKASFVHYYDNSMEALEQTAILDTDRVDASNRSYYSIPAFTLLQKNGTQYSVDSNGSEIILENAIWKLSDKSYMVVSPTIEFVISADSKQTFQDFVQVEYGESGIVDLATQQGTYRTISSDAYLEMANGVQIYLGSKNLSNGQKILMNMTQMVVNSEDTIEPIPDSQFNNENVEEPKIVVEASDGEDGKDGEEGETGAVGEAGEDGKAGEAGAAGEEGAAGEDGEDGEAGATGENGASGNQGKNGKAGDPGKNGENGANGNPGNPGGTGSTGDSGDEGDPGDPGQNSKTANVNFTEEKSPVFSAELTPGLYSLKANIKYNENGTQVKTETTRVSIVETSSGLTVWSVTPGDDVVKGSGFEISCDSLAPGKNYALVVNTAYYPMGTEEESVQDVLTKYFVTESVGLTLDPKGSTDSTVNARVRKTEANPVKTIFVKLYDENQQLLQTSSFMKPVDGTVVYDDTEGFSVSAMNKGEGIDVSAQGTHNTVYYAQIAVTTYGESVSANYSFPLVKLQTLKLRPTLDAPDASVIGAENAFLLEAGQILDPDNGIVSYRYEVYPAGHVTEAGPDCEPVYTIDLNNPKSAKVPVGDDTGVEVNESYRVRLVAIFHDNQSTLEYPSPFSAPVSMDSSRMWPVTTHTEKIITASTVEGTVVIRDDYQVIPSEGNNRIHVKIQPAKLLKKPTATGTEDWQEAFEAAAVFVKDFEGRTTFEIPYMAQGLKAGTAYNVYVTVDSMTANGSAGTDVMVSGFSVTTKDTYPGLKMHGVPGDTDDGLSFRQYIFFTTAQSAEKEAEQAQIRSGITGVENLSHFASKSLEYLKLSLYDGTKLLGTWYREGTDGSYLLYDRRYQDVTKYPFVQNEQEIGSGTFDRNINPLRTTLYTENSDLSGYTGDWCKENGFGVEVTIEDFVDETGHKLSDTEIATLYQGRTLTIRAEAYDYTYRTGGPSASYVDTQSGKTSYCNPIPVVNELAVELGVPAPSWDIITASMKADPIKKSDLKENDFALQKAYLKEQTDKTRGGSNAWDYLNYTGKNLEGVPGQYAGLWDELNDDTIIGYRIYGPTEGMNYYAAEVRYSVYSSSETDPGTGRLKETKLVTQSPWIVNPSENQDRVDGRLPSWDYLLEIPGNDTTKPVIERGQDFYVKVQVKMNNRCDITQGEGQRTWSGQIYPDWFEEQELLSMGDKRDMFFGLVAPRQRPSISLVQWDGTIGSRVQYLVKLVDVDEALRASDPEQPTETETTGYSDYHTAYGHISFYQDGVFKNAIRMIPLPGEISLPEPEKHFLAFLDVTSDTSKSLTVQYRLYEDNTLLDPSSHEAEWKTMELDPYRKTGLIGVKTATLLNQTEAVRFGKTFLKELDPCIIVAEDSENYNCVPAVLNETEHTISFRYYFFDAAGSDGFAKYVLTVAGKKGSTVEGRYTKEFSCNDPALTIDSKTVTVEPESKQFYLCEYTVDYTTDPEIIGLTGCDTIQVTLNAYRETGDYGLKYAASAETHYAMQKRDVAEYYRPDQTVSGLSDALVYSGTNPSVTISSGDTLLKAGSITIPFEGHVDKPTVYSYSADALDYIPRKAMVFSAAAEQPNPLESILPTYAHKAAPGFSEARITLTLDGKGSIRNESTYQVDNDPAKKAGLMLFYTTLEPSGTETFDDCVSDSKYNQKPLQITEPVEGKCTVVTFLGTDVDGEGHKTAPLASNKKYYCLLYGYSNGVWSLLKTIDQEGSQTPKFDFETLKEIAIKQIPITGSEYYQYYSKRAADGNVKAVRMKFHVPAVTYSDLQYAARHLFVSAERATDQVSAIQQTDLVQAMLEAFPDKESSLPQEFDFIAELPWSSAAATIMGKTYVFKAAISYPSGEPKPIGMQNSTPENWPKYESKYGNGKSYLTLLVSPDYDSAASDKTKAGTVAVRVSGKDTQWLFRGLKSGKNPGEDDNIGSDTQVKIRISIYDASLNNPQPLETKEFARPISDAGTVSGISEKNCIFKGLEPGKSYVVKAKVYWDENNNGKIDEGEEYVVSRTTGKLPLADVSVNSTMLNFEGSQGVVLVQGYNLSYVTKIKYQLRKDGTDLEQKTISTEGGDHSWANWGIDPQRLEPNWKLIVPEMDDPGSVYVLKVTFYKANDDKVGDGEYTVQWGQETVSPAAELMRSFLNWLGG